MKLFWKVFLSITVTTVTVFCFSGHLLIQIFFENNMNSAVTQARRINASIGSSMEETGRIYFNQQILEGDVLQSEKELEIKEMQMIMEAISISKSAEILGLCVRNEKKEIVFRDAETFFSSPFSQKIDFDTSAYRIQFQEEKYYMNYVSAVEIETKVVYLESITDVTDIFAEKESQYQIYSWILSLLIGMTAGLAMMISLWITLPIKRLSKAAREVAGGNYETRLHEKGGGELAQLAEDFNFMTESLEKNIQKLQEESRRREEFVGSFSHEMKTPVTSIIGYADMIRTKQINEEERMNYGSHIYFQGKRLESLSRKMLQLIVAQNTKLELQNIYLIDFFASILSEMELILEKRKITVCCHPEDVCIAGDADLLKTVFINFIDNAMKAIGTGGSIEISSASSDTTCRIFVSDTGKGIPKGEIEKLTEHFYMVDKSRKYVENSAGLGLTICDTILKAHKAWMKIESEEGKGTTVITEFVLGRGETNEE